MRYEASSMDPRQFNRAFLAYLTSKEDGLQKMAAAGAAFVRDHLREEGAFRRILPFEKIDPASPRVIPSLNSDTLVVRKDLEPQSRAFAMTFGAEPNARIISGRRIDIPFATITSERMQIREQHLLAYEMPVTQLIEENTGNDIQEIEDLEWLTHSQAAIAATQQLVLGVQAAADRNANSGATNTGFRGILQRPDYVNLVNRMVDGGNRKRVDKIWMNDVDFNAILTWTVEDMGNNIESETLVDGYKYDKVLGYRVVRTVKTDLFKTGNIYAYTAPEFLGFAFILNDVKFYLDKRANLIIWQAWEDVAPAIGNISSLVKLELYNGYAAGQSGSDPLPTEDDLFQQTNPADSGGAYFPQVTLF